MLHLLQFPDLGFLLYLKLELRLQEQGRVVVQDSPCTCLLLLWVSVREAARGQKPRHCRGCGLRCQAFSRKGLLRFHFYHQCWERQKGKRARFHETVATLGIPGFSFRKLKHACPRAVSHWPAADYLRSVSLSLLQEHPLTLLLPSETVQDLWVTSKVHNFPLGYGLLYTLFCGFLESQRKATHWS